MTSITVVKRDGSREPLQPSKIDKVIQWASQGLNVDLQALLEQANLMFFEGIETAVIHDSLIKAATALITVEKPDYQFLAARLLLQKLYKQTVNDVRYPRIRSYILAGVTEDRLNPELLTKFDLEELDLHIDQSRDLLFDYVGMQTLIDRYLIRETVEAGKDAKIIELPQHFWMRVAMGLSLNEDNPTKRAIEFYNVLSKLEYVSSTPTLFNSGTNHSQMSSCYLNTVADSLSAEDDENRYASIYGTIEECARLSKFAGGIGTDWTRVRSQGQPIVSTNGKSSGIVPYMKVFNDTAVAVNQGGKRNGAFAAYLEPWHPDFEDFIDLKKNSGDERRRAHDIFPAAWIGDLLMQRAETGGLWSFFAPDQYPELHELYGNEFKVRYEQLEAEGKYVRQVPAEQLWRKMMNSLYETGHPWVTFKDECNRRNPQDHAGVIHNSNLCTEITLNTSDDETAVCNLGSINLSRVNTEEDFQRVIPVAIRMLDNVIDLNFYPSSRSRNSNMRHRPIGLGVMGYAELLAQRGIDWESQEHLNFNNALFETISYYAISASAELAGERGAYSSFKGSKWSRGILPIDTAIDHTELDLSFDSLRDWDVVRELIAENGMRNSNVMAIAPTATISNIAGTTPTVEPIFKRQFSKTNLSGQFTVIDPSLRWAPPELCKTAFEIDQVWVIKRAAVTQRWVDQAQSLNLFAKFGTKGRTLSEWYFLAWRLKCKTTYYLRTQSAEADGGEVIVPVVAEVLQPEPEPKVCSINNPDCESCQ